MSNRLAQESSPYLLQHAENPVDWYPWGEEAFARARQEQKPIFLSIGYSACHWCHVMEHESFENDQIAAQLNAGFISIKVDREERPDLDQIYMQAVQMLTGRGGWPMSVFLTPEGHPFFGGTYWPPHSSRGMPGFDQVMQAVLDAWVNRRSQALEQAELLTERITELSSVEADASASIDPDLLPTALGRLEQSFDWQHGGFGQAPKFPHPTDLRLLLRGFQRFGHPRWLDMVRLNLDKMATGGIFDHLGGGFARYSVDARWLVPHFEKMLYDNAQLAIVYLETFQVTGEESYSAVARQTLDYVLRDLTDSAGGFHSTEDADSEGEEGKFYVWSREEVERLLGPELAEKFCYVYDVTEGGNFEGQNILHRAHSWEDIERLKGWPTGVLQAELAEARATLFAAREQRVRPGKDDKILVSWNALMIDALARGGWTLDEPRYLAAAQLAARFLKSELWTAPDRLLHTWRHAEAKLMAYLDDYACLADALVTLYLADQDSQWLEWAQQLADVMMTRFRDSDGGGFYFTADNHESLITRTQDWYDSSVPSGNGSAATALLRLGWLTGRTEYLEAAEQTLLRGQAIMRDRSPAAGQLLLAADLWHGPTFQLAMCEPSTADTSTGETSEVSWPGIAEPLRHTFLPRVLWAVHRSEMTTPPAPLAALLDGKSPQNSQWTIYPCTGFRCEAPVVGSDAAKDLIQKLAKSGHVEA